MLTRHGAQHHQLDQRFALDKPSARLRDDGSDALRRQFGTDNEGLIHGRSLNSTPEILTPEI
jgi:hypothetical protein